MRILLVEDEEKVSRFILRGLTAESFAVDTAADGKAGLELAKTYEYDLIILDLMLPELSGTDVLHQIRSTNNHVPILMLTAKDTVQDRIQGLDAGADDYMIKPFSEAQLRARARSWLTRTGR